MDTSEPINSTLEDRLVHQNTRLEKDKDQGVRNVVQQSIYEEKLANNGLYASIFLHFFLIISTVSIVLFKMSLITVYRENDPAQGCMMFSLFNFDINLPRNKTSYSYFCYEKGVRESEDDIMKCTINENCVKRGLNSTLIEETFELNCEHFLQFRVIGIVYTVILSIGNLMGFISCCIILLLLYEKLSLEKTEQFIFFTKFESVAYFIGFFIYFSFVGIFMEMTSHFLKQTWFLIFLFGISFTNFLVFRRSFYNKLRIKARIM